jgi:hypothetical protein
MSTAHRPTWNPAQGKEVAKFRFTSGVYTKTFQGQKWFPPILRSRRRLADQVKVQAARPDIDNRRPET